MYPRITLTLSTLSTDSPDREREYETLLEPHRAGLQRYAYQLTRNAAEAEDLVQETLLRAYTHLHQLSSSRGTVGGWLHTIQLNIFRNKITAADALSRPHLSLEPSFAESRIGDAPDPEKTTVLSECHEATMRALSALPPTYREAVVLCDIEGRHYQEIADWVGVPVGTVRSRISRGRKLLRRRLFAWGEG